MALVVIVGSQLVSQYFFTLNWMGKNEKNLDDLITDIDLDSLLFLHNSMHKSKDFFVRDGCECQNEICLFVCLFVGV